MTETAQLADLVMPASLPFEIGGHFTNTQRFIQKVYQTIPSLISETSYDMLFTLLKKLGVKTTNDVNEVLMEVISLLPEQDAVEGRKYKFITTADNFYKPLFEHGCDCVVKIFDNDFDRKLN